MSTKQVLHQTVLKTWASRFTDQKASGLTIVEWCRQNGISRDSYFYWKRKLKDELVTQILPDIVPLSLPDIPAPDRKPIFSVPSQNGRTSCTTWSTCTTDPTDASARIHIGDVMIELNSSVPERFITSVIKAVRNA